jgi:Na+-translocating ferredoxin:NAD+ oxidoreductase RnfG subunit
MAELRSAANVVLIGLGCALALGAVHHWTEDEIRFNETRMMRSALVELTHDPAALPEELPDLSTVPAVWRLCDGTLLAHSAAAGYGGPLSLIYTVFADPPRLHRLRVMRHQETPGITDFLREDDGWLASLRSLTSSELREVATLTGATITTRALRDHLVASLAAERLAGATVVDGCQP